jgi:hypothetical protein
MLLPVLLLDPVEIAVVVRDDAGAILPVRQTGPDLQLLCGACLLRPRVEVLLLHLLVEPVANRLIDAGGGLRRTASKASEALRRCRRQRRACGAPSLLASGSLPELVWLLLDIHAADALPEGRVDALRHTPQPNAPPARPFPASTKIKIKL